MSEINPQRPSAFTSGEVLTAGKLDVLRRSIDRGMGGVNPPRQKRSSGARASVVIQQFQIMAIYGDYLECSPFDGFSTPDPTNLVKIAKPYLLRVSLTSRNSITYSFGTDAAGLAGSERTATDGSNVAIEKVDPPYVAAVAASGATAATVGDTIYAARSVVGGVGVRVTNYDGTLEDLEWIDQNYDGRKWLATSGMLNCRIATTANHGLSGLSAIDGTTPVDGDLILVWKQSTASQNGIYRAASGTWTKVVSFTAVNLYRSISVNVGTLYGKSFFVVSASNTASGMGAYYQ